MECRSTRISPTRRHPSRGYEIPGEATRRLPSEVNDADPDIPWIYMAAVRKIRNHLYTRLGIDSAIIQPATA
jgi:uncharacterized protein with HEPN domain